MKNKTEKWTNNWSRRKFLTRVGMVGGACALYETMVAMNVINTPPEWAGPPKLKANHGQGKSVLILGAGIGGLTAAYLLSQYGYRCEILEATSRAGGRNHTARRGTTIIEESEEHGKTIQHCRFDDGLYMNLGPGRLPYHHRRVLGYCRELNVELEPYIMNTTGNLFQTSEGKVNDPMVYRNLQNDTRGYISEFLAKAINQTDLDLPLDKDDHDKLLSLLQAFGPLTSPEDKEDGEEAYKYKGSTRDGCGTDPQGRPTPNVFHSCDAPEKTPIDVLLDSEFWKNNFYDPVEFEWQPTLFQPVGGMDMIVEGFLRKVGHLIRYNAPVVKITSKDDCVEVKFQDGAETVTKKADYCVSNIPCPVLKEIDNNFKGKFLDAVNNTAFDSSCKVGWQCNTRFWEDDKYQIYGGISWTDNIIEQIWYPSNGYFSQKGTLTGAYIHDQPGKGKPKNATEFGKLSLPERLKKAKAGGKKLHKEFDDDTIVPTELGLSIAWQNIPYLAGAWPFWGDHQDADNTKDKEDAEYRQLLSPFGRFYVVGDQASTVPGWQEGAMMSAEHVVELIAGLKEDIVPEEVTAPNTFKSTQGRRH